jgi:hypothetical protein
MKAYKVSGGIAPLIPNPGATRRCAVSLTARNSRYPLQPEPYSQYECFGEVKNT